MILLVPRDCESTDDEDVEDEAARACRCTYSHGNYKENQINMFLAIMCPN